MNVLDLFAGIGGFSLGLERTGGFETVAFCEIEPYAQKVLKKNWPGVPVYEDVKELTGERLRTDGISVEIITGGFPCQDISVAGRGAGLAGERSGLWSEIARLIGELRPRYAIMENVSALLGRGLDKVLADLAALGYDAEWHCIPASAVGAPHIRDRIWIIAYPNHRMRRRGEERGKSGDGQSDVYGAHGIVAATKSKRLEGRAQRGDAGAIIARFREGGGAVSSHWRVEPNVGRVANGIPRRVDRIRCLGNAVVPQIPEMLGRAILARESL